MRRFLFSILVITIFNSCFIKEKKTFSICYDPYFTNLVLDGQEKNFNGFIKDFLLSLAKDEKIEIKLIEGSFDNIFQNLQKNEYMAVLSNLQPLNFNQAKYSFSNPFLNVGFCLVVNKGQKKTSLESFSNVNIGYIESEKSFNIINQYENIFPKPYLNLPSLFNDLKNENIAAGVTFLVPTYKYVNDLYYDDLKIVKFLDNDAIRLIALKDQNLDLIKIFNSYYKKLEENGRLKKLKDKWQIE